MTSVIAVGPQATVIVVRDASTHGTLHADHGIRFEHLVRVGLIATQVLQTCLQQLGLGLVQARLRRHQRGRLVQGRLRGRLVRTVRGRS